MSNELKNFLENIKVKCAAKAKEMAALELSVWDSKHENELVKYHGLTRKQVKDRKLQLIATK